MRDYAKFSPKFWTGRTGRSIRALVPSARGDAQRVAAYLFTCPNSTMIGLYYLPLATMCDEIGISSQGARKALSSLKSLGYSDYDEEWSHVWVIEMAAWQVGPHLKRGDNRVDGVVNELLALGKSPFFSRFVARYREDFELYSARRWTEIARIFEGPPGPPSEGLASQEQEQEQEKEQEQEQEQEQEGEKRRRSTPTTSIGQVPDSLDGLAWGSAIALAALWNELRCSECSRVQVLTPGRAKKAREYLALFPDEAWWRQSFSEAATSSFLRGLKNDPGDHENFRATFDWFLQRGKIDNVENCLKAYEGKYRDGDRGLKRSKGDKNDMIREAVDQSRREEIARGKA